MILLHIDDYVKLPQYLKPLGHFYHSWWNYVAVHINPEDLLSGMEYIYLQEQDFRAFRCIGVADEVEKISVREDTPFYEVFKDDLEEVPNKNKFGEVVPGRKYKYTLTAIDRESAARLQKKLEEWNNVYNPTQSNPVG